MNWIENIDHWRRLSPEAKLQHRREAIPLDVAQSMAFEGEPVPVERLRLILKTAGRESPPQPAVEHGA